VRIVEFTGPESLRKIGVRTPQFFSFSITCCIVFYFSIYGHMLVWFFLPLCPSLFCVNFVLNYSLLQELHPLSHLRILAKSYLTVCPLRPCSTWGLILNLKRSALPGYRANIITFSHDNYFKYFQSIALSTAWGLNDFAVINDTHLGLIYKTS